jgi:hypothetical protein
MAPPVAHAHPDDLWHQRKGRGIVESQEAERIAKELAGLLAQEHRLLAEERSRRLQAEEAASELAVELALDRAELEREREARKRAEAQASELSTLMVGDGEEDRVGARFIPAPRSADRRLQRLQRVV